jgi:hypothetical protein
MIIHRCPYCHETFFPSRYRPDQVVCSAPNCQRQRRAAYHRKKLRVDAAYREQCRESQQLWRDQHPDYMRSYREARSAGTESRNTNQPARINTILNCVKNNVASDVTLWTGRVYVIEGRHAKSILAKADLLVIAGLARTERGTQPKRTSSWIIVRHRCIRKNGAAGTTCFLIGRAGASPVGRSCRARRPYGAARIS